MKKIILIAIAILLISNLPIFDFLINEDYNYENIDATFTYEENSGKGLNYISVVKAYTIFRCQHSDKDQGDNKLYRTFTVKPWRFWEWKEFIFHSDRFLLPYKQPVKND